MLMENFQIHMRQLLVVASLQKMRNLIIIS